MNRQILIYAILIAIGALGGYLYWRFVGCQTGSCSLTSTWYNSSAIGGLIGYLSGDTIKDKIKTKRKK